MTVATINVLLNGAPVPVELDQAALDAIAAALPAPAEPWPEWLDAFKAAEYLGVSVERVRHLKAAGEIPYFQEGPNCKVMFRRSELDAWMETFRVPPQGGDAQTTI